MHFKQKSYITNNKQVILGKNISVIIFTLGWSLFSAIVLSISDL